MMMRKIVTMIAAAAVLLSSASCQRRPLSEADYSVNVVINIDKDIVNYTVTKDPELMRVAFFDHSDGHLVTHAYLPASGGSVNVYPGRTYDVLAYNFDTEITNIKDENNFGRIYATTSSISDEFKSKLRSRGVKSPVGEEDEDFCYDPDHLFVGRLNNVDIPARTVDSPSVTLTIDCSTVVQTWIIEVDKVKNPQWIGSITAVVNGLSRASYIAAPEMSIDHCTVFFDWETVGSDGVLRSRFNTFGMNPEAGQKQYVSLNITNTSGKFKSIQCDVSDQFVNNKEQIIRIKSEEIDVPEPDKGGSSGGFQPSVDEWQEIHSNIDI